MAVIGLAYDRNKMSHEQVMARRKRTGDLSIHSAHNYNEEHEHDF